MKDSHQSYTLTDTVKRVMTTFTVSI